MNILAKCKYRTKNKLVKSANKFVYTYFLFVRFANKYKVNFNIFIKFKAFY